MATYLDLDDAAANVVGDVAQRELDELRRQRDELEKALRWIDWALNKDKNIYTAGDLVTKALANIDTVCSSQNTESDTQHELRCMSERQEQPVVPERWLVDRRDGMYLIQQKDADGSFTKGLWIDPDQYSYVLCEMLNDMQQGGRE